MADPRLSGFKNLSANNVFLRRVVRVMAQFLVLINVSPQNVNRYTLEPSTVEPKKVPGHFPRSIIRSVDRSVPNVGYQFKTKTARVREYVKLGHLVLSIK